MHTEDDLLPISALQHLLFCERQTALIHIERLWEENRFTAEGRALHRKADAAKSETRDGIRITRGLPVHSFKLGLYGVCDVVQFKSPDIIPQPKLSLPKRIEQQLRLTRASGEAALGLPRANGEVSPDSDTGVSGEASPAGRVKQTAFQHWTITLVEYKRGKPKANDCDRVQLCAQAMCLEEMLNVDISRGDLFYGKQQHRTEVRFDNALRTTTEDTVNRLHALIQSRQTPHAIREKKCDTCSLLSVCMPPKVSRSAKDYVQKMIQ
ncbi:MAG: CRISPR-associated protein Cas4 [Planctomycetaceae bacterium]